MDTDSEPYWRVMPARRGQDIGTATHGGRYRFEYHKEAIAFCPHLSARVPTHGLSDDGAIVTDEFGGGSVPVLVDESRVSPEVGEKECEGPRLGRSLILRVSGCCGLCSPSPTILRSCRSCPRPPQPSIAAARAQVVGRRHIGGLRSDGLRIEFQLVTSLCSIGACVAWRLLRRLPYLGCDRIATGIAGSHDARADRDRHGGPMACRLPPLEPLRGRGDKAVLDADRLERGLLGRVRCGGRSRRPHGHGLARSDR